MKIICMTAILSATAISSGCVNHNREYSEREPVVEAVEIIEVTAADGIVECSDTVDDINTVLVPEIIIIEDEDPVEVVEEIPVVEEPSMSSNVGLEDINVIKQEVIEEEERSDLMKKVYGSAEQMPSFPGGDAELLKFLRNNIRYPETAVENGIQGTVLLQFVVNEDGSIGDIKVVRSKDPELDREAIRVVRMFPQFNPGYLNGEAVKTWYTLPVRFKLPNE